MNLDSDPCRNARRRDQGLSAVQPALPISAIGAQRWSLLAGDLPLPLAVIRDSALAHNHAWMRDFTASTGVLLAPHGKTTMAPQIFAQQLAAGAWGITVANVQQLGICVRFGVRRVIMANQLLGAAEVGAVIRLQEEHPDLEFHFLDRFAGATRRRSRVVAGIAADVAQAHRAGRAGRAGRPHRRADVRRGARRRARRRGEQGRRAVGPRMLRRAADHRRLGPRRNRRCRADAARARRRARLRPRGTLRRSVDHPHRGRLGRVRHRRARSADEAIEARADDPAQRLLRHARFGLLQPHAGRRESAQRRRLAVAPGPAAGARSLVASAILPRAGAGDPHDGQARRVVRPRDADRRQTLPPGNRRRAAARAGIVEDRQHERSARRICASPPTPTRRRRSAIWSAAASRIRARPSTNGAPCSRSTTTIA